MYYLMEVLYYLFLVAIRSGYSIYHSMAYGTVIFLQAVFCVERVSQGRVMRMCGIMLVYRR